MALGCFAHGACVAALFVGIAALLDRGGRRASLPFAAALGGLLASWALGLHCSIAHPAHLLLGHAAVGFVMASLALLAARALERDRHARLAARPSSTRLH